jgi:Amt family ammonium transporter
MLGFIAAIVSNLVAHYKTKTAIDDTLDVFPCHGVGGMVGMLLTGVFATTAVNSLGKDGLIYGHFELLKDQICGLLIVVAYSFSVSYGIFKLINLIHPLRVSDEDESLGLDVSQHNENYHPALLSVHDNGALKEEQIVG